MKNAQKLTPVTDLSTINAETNTQTEAEIIRLQFLMQQMTTKTCCAQTLPVRFYLCCF